MRYQIWIPKAVGCDVENLRRVGLGDLLASQDDNPDMQELSRGPDGQSGQLWGWDSGQDVLNWNPNDYEAIPCVADPTLKLSAGRFSWVFRRGQRPTEEELRRSGTYKGNETLLANDQTWIVANVLALPETFGFDESGEVIKTTAKQWKPFVDDAEWALSLCVTDGTSSRQRDWKRELSVASRFLGANYRVNRELLIHLDLVTPKNVISVLLAGIDRDRLRDLIDQLKNQEAGAVTPNGSGVSAG